MRNATLRQLQILDAAARHQHFGRAAAELHLTQPAISIQMKQLELHAGTRLFENVGRQVRLTPAGHEIARYAHAMLALLREAEESLGAFKGIAGGEIHLATVSTAKYFAPKLLAEFRRGFPDVSIRLTVNNREAVVRALASNTVDLVIMGRPPRGIDAEATTFARHPLAVIAAPAHPLASRRRLALKELAAETFLIRERGSGTRAAMEQVFAERGFRPANTIEVSSNETIKQAVMAGLGVSFLSMHTAVLETATGRLAVLKVADTPVMRDWFVIHRRKRAPSPAAQAFRQFLVDGGEQLLARALD